MLDVLDGVLLTGSPSNVEPHHYGQESRPGTAHDPARDATTLPLIRHSIERGVPLFAICRGLQEVNVALGGSLHQLVHEVEGRRDHRSPKSPDTDVNYAPAHDIDIVEGGLLHRLLGERRVSGEFAARPGRRSPGAARPARSHGRRRPGRGLQRARCAGLRARPAVASRAQGAGESGLDESVRRLRRGLPGAHGGARHAPLRAAAAVSRQMTRAATTRNNARRDFYERIGGLSMAPLWESLHQLVPPAPAPKYGAAHWDYDKVRPFLMESGA